MKSLSILVLSNMYPTPDNQVRGIFVANFVRSIEAVAPDVIKEVVAVGSVQGGRLAKIQSYLRFYYQAARKIRGNSSDILYFHYPTISAIVLLLAPLHSQRNVVFNFHGTDLQPVSRLGSFLLYMFRNFTLRHARAIVVPSPYYRQIACRILGPDIGVPVIVSASGGYDPEMFFPSRQESGSGRFTVGYVSTLSKSKGIDVFMQIARALHGNYGDRMRFQIVGDGPEKSRVLADVQSSPLKNCVDFKPSVSQSELPDIFRRMDAFVFPTLRKQESLGLVGIEALATGVPVVATGGFGPSGYIKQGVNGFLFDKSRPDLAVKAVEAIYLLEESDRAKLSEAACNSVRAYRNHDVARSLLSELKKIFR